MIFINLYEAFKLLVPCENILLLRILIFLLVKRLLDIIFLLKRKKLEEKLGQQLIDQIIEQYNVTIGNTVTNSFRFHCVRFWEHRDDILACKK